jgi:hypothetical protein
VEALPPKEPGLVVVVVEVVDVVVTGGVHDTKLR